ncbi:MAG: hypothetical protein F4213_08240 [Boseongicola sp. SB0677_bin_26]|nr:hypothetical protein [Boseongicola sp. SB0665_bin_10]MYG26001.1 hypothetical protein [Boseongicola sp. SB0677_bin_26]
MPGIIGRLEDWASPGAEIPKPETGAYRVKGWGIRRGVHALIYFIPNHATPRHPYEKGVTVSEWEQAYSRLASEGELRRSWFERSMARCNEEGGCNFTAIGGVFVALGIAVRHGRGVYRKA